MNAKKSKKGTQAPNFERIRRLWEAGKTAREICAEIGCSSSTIYRAISADADFRARNRRGNYAADKEDQIRAMTAAGKKAEEIARETGLSQMTIYNFWIRNGLRRKPEPEPKPKPIPKKKEVTAEQREIILDLAGRAAPWDEITETTGLSVHVCERVLKEADLWPKPVNEDREDEDPPWWPEPGAQKYPDEFVLKPEDRARLNEVIKWRNEGAPMTERNRKRKEKEGAEWKA